MTIPLYLHAVRTARARQLRARAMEPVLRRRFPQPRRRGSFRPLDVALWRSNAFDGADDVAGDGSVVLLGRELAYPFADWRLPGEPRVRRFHAHYGDEILGWARRGDGESASRGMRSWIESNPPHSGDAWHPYPLSTRVGNWIAAVSLAPELADGSVTESLRRQLAYLARNVEDGVLGNHVIRNARALVLGGLVFDDRELLRRGVALLRRELPEQVLADGGHYERSPVYHLVVLRDLLEVRAAGGESWLDQSIEPMRRFAAALTRPDGNPALFNDGPLDLAPALELPTPAQGLSVFPDTGYVVLRDERIWLAFDCGAPSPPFLPAHAHADGLSFQLWVDGRPMVVDPGTYTYEPGPDRDWFRSTAAHSTVSIDGRSQFELWRAFRAGPFPPIELQHAGSDRLEASIHWRDDARHHRSVRLQPDRLEVDDVIEGDGRHLVQSRLQLAHGSEVDAHGPLDACWEMSWVSDRFFERSKAPALVATSSVKLPIRFGWSIPLAG